MDDVQDSPIVPEKPAFDFAYKYNQTIAVDSSLMYTGTIYFGDSFDGSSNVLYDSGSRLTVIPKKGANMAGWFDLTTASNVTLISSSTFEYTVLGQTIQCEMALGNLCGKNDAYEISVANDCAYVTVCLTEVSEFPNGYEGVVGLGKWTPKDTEANYLMELYI